jgi:hypothetical protein
VSGTLAGRFRSLPARWRVLGGLLVLLFLCTCGDDDDGGDAPPGLEQGDVLAGLQLAGEKPIIVEHGLSVVEVEGAWVALRFGKEGEPTRWINFRHVAAWVPETE